MYAVPVPIAINVNMFKLRFRAKPSRAGKTATAPNYDWRREQQFNPCHRSHRKQPLNRHGRESGLTFQVQDREPQARRRSRIAVSWTRVLDFPFLDRDRFAVQVPCRKSDKSLARSRRFRDAWGRCIRLRVACVGGTSGSSDMPHFGQARDDPGAPPVIGHT